MAIVSLKDVTYTYPVTTQPALKNISLKIEAGEFVAVIGANGAGKSTLCYTIAGFVPHFYKGELTGSVHVAGKETQASSLSEWVTNVGLVFQNPFNQMSGSKYTVYEELAFGLENLGVPRAEMKRRLERVIELTNIGSLTDRSPYALSGGQQQRVALASILVMEPAVLVLDEPTSQLDPIGSREVFQVIKQMSQQGITVVLAEHKIEWIAEFADRLVALADGELLATGTPQDVLTDPRLPDHNIIVSNYTTTARAALERQLWPAAHPLPVTLDQAVAGFAQGEKQRAD